MSKSKLNEALEVPDDIYKIKMDDAPPIVVVEKKDKRPDKPYLYISKNIKGFNENTIRALLKDFPICHIHHTSVNNAFFIYFDHITDMEESFRILNNVNFDLRIEVGQPKKIEEKLQELSLTETTNNENSIDKKSRTIFVSDINPQHPNFTQTGLIPFTEYKKVGSIIAKNDPKQRYFHVSDEHVLERCGAFKIDNIKLNEHCEYEFRNGSLVQRFTGEIDEKVTADSMCTPEEMTKILEQHDYQKCINCSQYCASYCPDCLSPFCSTNCEQKMRDEHEEACSKKITLSYTSPPPKEMKNEFLFDHMPATHSDVEITAFSRSNIVFVRSLNANEIDGYFHVLDEIRKQSEHAKKLVNMPICGQLVLLKLDSDYLRALVLNAEEPSGIHLICIDYGNVELQPLDNIYEIPSSLTVLPRYAVPVQLKAVPVCFMNEQYRKSLYFFMTRRRVTIEYGTRDFDYDTRLLKVVLRTDKLNKTINEEIIARNTALEPKMNDEFSFDSMLKKVPLSAGSNVELVIMDNTLMEYGIISCTMPKFTYEIQKIQNDIQIYGNSLKPMYYAPLYYEDAFSHNDLSTQDGTPRLCVYISINEVYHLVLTHQKEIYEVAIIVGPNHFRKVVNELCIAYYKEDNKWCRGRCLEVVGDGFPTISFLDYGNVCCVWVENIRPYPKLFLSFPLMTEDVEIMELPSKIDETAIEKLQKQLPIGGKIKCDLYYDEKEEYYYIKLPNV